MLSNIIRKSNMMPLLGIAISGFVMWIIIRKINFPLLKLSFEKLNLYWILLMVIIYIMGFFIRGMRWHFMLLPIKKISTRVAMEGVIVGYMANNILPARAGELVRVFFIGNKESISRTSLLGTIFIERIFDGLVIVGILIVSCWFLKFSDVDKVVINYVIGLSSLIFGIAILFLLLSSKYREYVEKFVATYLSKLPPKLYRPCSSIIVKLLESLKFLRNTNRLLRVFFLSLFIWFIEGLVFFIGFYAFDLPASLLIAYFTFAFVNLGMIIPSAPGGVGIFQGASILALSFFGISSETALSYSIVVHSVMIIPITLLGLLIINRYGLSIWKLRNI